ncbi:MAG: tRNA (adenosine(37)-N6)-threonylcarbamoyltransferase complex dimerization subunit type 1 TsaB, partial [Pseudomonadota bacterium]
TGVRIGLSVGKALGLAWQVPVFSYQCLHLVAVQALAENKTSGPFHVAMIGGHGEYFIQNFDAKGLAADDLRSLPPAEALAFGKGDLVAGSAAEALAELAANRTALPMFPDAVNALLLPESERKLSAVPVYGRPPDAQIIPRGT